MYKRECHVVARGAMNSVLIEFADGQRECVSRYSVRLKKMLMLDLGAGLCGASQAMKARGWNVITMDIDPDFNTDVVADMRTWSWTGDRPDLVWCSPPCTEFAKFAMPCWYPPETLPPPDMSLVIACKRIVDECNPRYWIIENVRGAVPFFAPILGKPTEVHRPYFLWGHFPPLGNTKRHTFGTKSKHLSSSAKAERARIPESLSLAVAIAIERQLELPLPNTVLQPTREFANETI